jgi:hypothetical protein
VCTCPFLSNEYSHVSAVLYSRANWICRPQRPGDDFILVHNPKAQCPLPIGWLAVGEEWRFDGSALLATKYSLEQATVLPTSGTSKRR